MAMDSTLKLTLGAIGGLAVGDMVHDAVRQHREPCGTCQRLEAAGTADWLFRGVGAVGGILVMHLLGKD